MTQNNLDKWYEETLSEIIDHLNMLLKVDYRKIPTGDLIDLEVALERMICRYVKEEK